MLDGAHIRALLLTFLFRFARPLIEEGKVFVCRPPLYKVKWGKDNMVYCRTVEDMERVTKELTDSGKIPVKDFVVSRFKGLKTSPEIPRGIGRTHLKLEGCI